MKKKLLVTFMALSLAANLMACGSANDAPDQTKSESVVETEGESKTETQIESDENEESLEAESSESNVEIINPVIYDEEGFTLTYLGFNDDYTTIRVKAENNNPDNKKVSFIVDSVRLNGMGFEKNCNFDSTDGKFGMVGTSAEYEICVDKESYEKVCSDLGIDTSERIIYAISIDYSVQIGSDAEFEPKYTLLKTTDYVDGYNDSYLSEYQLATLAETESVYMEYMESNLKENFDICYKKVEDGVVAVLKNSANQTFYFQEGLGVTIGIGNDEKAIIGYNTTTDYLRGDGSITANGGIMTMKFDKTASDIRAELEIPNDTPVFIYFDFYDINNETGEVKLYGYQLPIAD